MNIVVEEVFLCSIVIIFSLQLKCSSEDPHQDVKALLGKFSSNPEAKTQLCLLLPQIISSFGSNKSVTETIESLKRHHQSSDKTGEF